MNIKAFLLHHANRSVKDFCWGQYSLDFYRVKEIDQYAVLRQSFLLRKWCAVHGKPCIPTDVHHQKGKVGFCDEIAQEKGIPALIDIRYWIPCLQSGARLDNREFKRSD